MIEDTFDIVVYGKHIFYVRFDGLVKQAAVPLCFQPKWLAPSIRIRKMINRGKLIKWELPIDLLKNYDASITLARSQPHQSRSAA